MCDCLSVVVFRRSVIYFCVYSHAGMYIYMGTCIDAYRLCMINVCVFTYVGYVCTDVVGCVCMNVYIRACAYVYPCVCMHERTFPPAGYLAAKGLPPILLPYLLPRSLFRKRDPDNGVEVEKERMRGVRGWDKRRRRGWMDGVEG